MSAPCHSQKPPLLSTKGAKRRNMSYQKKNLDKKFASSTGDFCILSAPPVCSLCTWVVFVRVAHICVSPEWLRPHRQRDGVLPSFVLHFAPPVAEHVVTASFLLWCKILVSILSPSPFRYSRYLALSLSATVTGKSIFYGLAKTCGDIRHFHAD